MIQDAINKAAERVAGRGVKPTPLLTLQLGDLVHRVAGPIGKAVRWPCNQKNSTELKPGSPCDQARKDLNKLSDDFRS